MAQWYYRIDGETQGPISGKQLKQKADNGELKPNNEVRKEGSDGWAKAQKVKGLFREESSANSSDTNPSATGHSDNTPDLASAGKMFIQVAAKTFKDQAESAKKWSQEKLEDESTQEKIQAAKQSAKTLGKSLVSNPRRLIIVASSIFSLIVVSCCFLGLLAYLCLLYTSPSPRDRQKSRMPSSA